MSFGVTFFRESDAVEPVGTFGFQPDAAVVFADIGIGNQQKVAGSRFEKSRQTPAVIGADSVCMRAGNGARVRFFVGRTADHRFVVSLHPGTDARFQLEAGFFVKNRRRAPVSGVAEGGAVRVNLYFESETVAFRIFENQRQSISAVGAVRFFTVVNAVILGDRSAFFRDGRKPGGKRSRFGRQTER